MQKVVAILGGESNPFPNLGDMFSFMKLQDELIEYSGKYETSNLTCHCIYSALVISKTPLKIVVKELQEQIKENRNGIISSIGEDLTKRIECFKFS